MIKVVVLRESCKGMDGCGICKFVCPQELFVASEKMNEGGYIPPEIKNEEECIGCSNCMVYCPDFAIVVEKETSKGGDEQEQTDG
jgi:2-oxoglutarate ferredoxin oxidoreductase subunit delta